MPKYEALAHVLWELPFPLRLPPRAVFCWEPGEGQAVFDPRPEVGELAWRRRSQLLAAADVFSDLGPRNGCYPTRDYLVVSQLRDGRQIKTLQLTRGPEGGFAEARPYAIANIFLCLRQRAEYAAPAIVERAGTALNNILDSYRFITMDPLVRSMRVDQDAYYTLVSVADLPRDVGDIEARAALEMMGQVAFGSVVGVNRAHRVGLNSFDDLVAGDTIGGDALRDFNTLITVQHELELFHQLIFSAIRRLKRREHALAVLDAQSAVESLVAGLVVENLTAQGQVAQQIETAMGTGGQFHTLQRRLTELDRLAATSAAPESEPPQFLGSAEEQQWRAALYALRNRVVHEGLRDLPFAEGRAAIAAGLRAIHKIQGLTPAFNRAMIWSDAALAVEHLQQSTGRMFRLFEA